MGRKMTPIRKWPRRMLHVFSFMRSNREDWPQITSAHLLLLKHLERPPHENEPSGPSSVPITTIPVGCLQLPGNRRATVLHLPGVMEWYGSGTPTAPRHP